MRIKIEPHMSLRIREDKAFLSRYERKDRMERGVEMLEMESCALCPRECRVNRGAGQRGACGVPAEVYAARAALHMWEEPCISGERGSGAVFFSGCPLHCVYCQNQMISEGKVGKAITIQRLAEIFLELQSQNAANINLVTPTHYTPQIIEAVRLSREKGLYLPIVYNCSGYEKVETLQSLERIVDIYLVDFKYMEADLAKRYSRAADYPEKVKTALAEMVRQQKKPMFDENGMMRNGVIVRHLLLPGHVQNAKAVVQYVYEMYGNDVYLSLMNQYTPPAQSVEIPELNRRVTCREYESLVDYAIELGVENGFIQEGKTAKESYIPTFDCEGI